jgi:Calcineurin-like phosphoesterase
VKLDRPSALLAFTLLGCGAKPQPAAAPTTAATSSAVAPPAALAPEPAASAPPLASATTLPSAAPMAAPVASTAAVPASANCGMPAALFARGWRTKLSPTSAVETPPFEAGTTTLVVLPDTQYYASCASRHFGDQVRWAAEQKTRRNVPLVLTLGDLTDRNTPAEWAYIQSNLAPVQNQLPFVLVTGNHDHSVGGTATDRVSLLQQYFPDAPGAAASVLAERLHAGDIENAYYRVPLAKTTLGVLALEWSPQAATVEWANRVLDRYAHDRVVVVTHAYLYFDSTRYDWEHKGKLQEWDPLSYGTGKGVPEKQPRAATLSPDDGYDGEMLWQDLVRRHAGIFLVLSGHVLANGTGVLSSRGDHGNLVHQVVVNYQMLEAGGLGYLRLIELLSSGKTLRMKSFSPTLKLFATGRDQTGDLALEPPLW